MKKVFTVKEPFGEPTHGVVTEVDMFEGNVARGEDMGRQQLPAHMLLTELLKIRSPVKKIQICGLSENYLDVISEG